MCMSVKVRGHFLRPKKFVKNVEWIIAACDVEHILLIIGMQRLRSGATRRTVATHSDVYLYLL